MVLKVLIWNLLLPPRSAPGAVSPRLMPRASSQTLPVSSATLGLSSSPHLQHAMPSSLMWRFKNAFTLAAPHLCLFVLLIHLLPVLFCWFHLGGSTNCFQNCEIDTKSAWTAARTMRSTHAAARTTKLTEVGALLQGQVAGLWGQSHMAASTLFVTTASTETLNCTFWV